ncbi:MAG TPA: DUF721 domain-containing protein [Patescibacteria group bacterium]
MSGFQKVDQVLKSNLKRKNVAEALSAAMLFTLWPKVIARVIPNAYDCRPKVLKAKSLTISTTSHIQAAELRLRAPQLLKELNILAGKRAVERLVFKVDQ